MMRLLIATAVLVSFIGCNINESKEGRLQKLEAQSKQTAAKIQDLQQRIESLESHAIKNGN